MKKSSLTYFIFFSGAVFGQRGTPLDAYEYWGDPWSKGNIILWALIIIALIYSAAKSLGRSEAEKEIRNKQKENFHIKETHPTNDDHIKFEHEKKLQENKIHLFSSQVTKKPSVISNQTPVEEIKTFDYSIFYYASEVYVEFIGEKRTMNRALIGKNAVLSHEKHFYWNIEYDILPTYKTKEANSKLRQVFGKADTFDVINSDLFFTDRPVTILDLINEKQLIVFSQSTLNSDVFGISYKDYSTNKIVVAQLTTTCIRLIFEGIIKKN